MASSNGGIKSKRKEINSCPENYRAVDALRAGLFDYSETLYNRPRRNSSPGYAVSAAYEQQFRESNVTTMRGYDHLTLHNLVAHRNLTEVHSDSEESSVPVKAAAIPSANAGSTSSILVVPP